MTLDAQLFTLHFVRRRTEPWIVDIYPSTANHSPAPPVPSKDEASTSRPTAFTGTIPDVAAQRALALESIDFSKQTPSYTRVRATNHTQYTTMLLDGLVPDCLLASIFQPYTAKKKQIMLYSPNGKVELEKRSMTFQQAWRFEFSDADSSTAEEFSWKRQGGSSWGASTQSAYVCEVIRKPDPSVLAAQYSPPSGKGKPGTLQLMDYNINRLDVQDKKGLEVALVMTLSAILDQEYDDKLAARGERSMYVCSSGIPTDLSMQAFGGAWREVEARHGEGAAGSPKAETARGSPDIDAATMDRIANLEPNELLVTKWGSTEEYVEHALQLFRSDGKGQSMDLIALHSDSAETTPKVVQVAAAIKAAYYRLPDDAKGTVYGRSQNAKIEEELYQYVQTMDDPETKPPAVETTPKKRVINLNAPETGEGRSVSPKATGYQPPSKLKIILSKERIAELEPKKQPEVGTASPNSQQQTKMDVPSATRPALPSRPVSPPPQPATQNRPDNDKMGKGKAILSKLGFHH